MIEIILAVIVVISGVTLAYVFPKYGPLKSDYDKPKQNEVKHE